MAIREVRRTFSEKWIERHIKDVMAGKEYPHPILQYFFDEGLFQLNILFDLGRDLIELKKRKRIERLKRRLRKSNEFIGAFFEVEIAADCLRRGSEMELSPTLPTGQTPDLKIQTDSKDVYLELSIYPSAKYVLLKKLCYSLFYHIYELVQENTRIKLSLSSLPSEDQLEQTMQSVKQVLINKTPLPYTFQIKELRINLDKEKDDWGKGVAIEVPPDIKVLELKRLTERIEKAIKQLPDPYLSTIVFNAANLLLFKEIIVRAQEHDVPVGKMQIVLGEFDKYDVNIEIEGAIKKYFQEVYLPNIIGVFIICSFKFFRAPDEVTVVENLKCKEKILLKEFEGLRSFSRARPL